MLNSGYKSYSVGFLFDTEKEKVILVEKNRPDWQKGKLNAPGGHIESNEEARNAVIREYEEETGLEITDWFEFCLLRGTGYEVHFFVAETNDEYLSTAKSLTDEKIFVLDIKSIDENNLIPNLKWLIPMALECLTEKSYAVVSMY